MTSNPKPAGPHWLSYADDADSFPAVSDRDAASLVLPDLDYDAQVRAIEKMLDVHRGMDQAELTEIKRVELIARQSTGFHNEQAVEEHIERLYESTYHDAARSMAAIGMLAPFIESVFAHAFASIQRLVLQQSLSLPVHDRWTPPARQKDRDCPWDPRYVCSGATWSLDVARGIPQLADAVGLSPYLPQDLATTLLALTAYRNKMFHCGFEWPISDRSKFAGRIASSEWPAGWFSSSTSGGEPWVFYMTDLFVKHCLNLIEQVIVGVGAFCNATFLRR